MPRLNITEQATSVPTEDMVVEPAAAPVTVPNPVSEWVLPKTAPPAQPKRGQPNFQAPAAQRTSPYQEPGPPVAPVVPDAATTEAEK